MADFYCDHGAYGTSSNRIGLDAPTTWGVPQEGDGAATAASTAAGVAEILINAVPTASETIVIAGATITAGASAGANTFVRGAATTDTAANIVTLINSANFTNTVGTSVVRTTGITTNANQGRNLFYARVKPGQNSTVQIMWRIGSTALDYSNNANVAITTSGWGTPPTITQFTGGESGCFGWFINPVALGQGSSLAVMAYGVFFAYPTVVKSGTSSVYTPTYSDTIWLRSGAGQTVAWAATTNAYSNVGRTDIHICVDSNTKWTGDSGNGVFELKITDTSTFQRVISFIYNNLNAKVKISAIKKGGMKFSSYTTGTTTVWYCVYSSSSGDLAFDNVTFEEDAASTGTGGLIIPSPMGNSGGTVVYSNCTFNYLRAFATGRQLLQVPGGSANSYKRSLTFHTCEFNFNYTGTVTPTTGLFGIHGTTGSNAWGTVRITGCRITGLGSYKQPIFTMASAWVANDGVWIDLTAENVSGAEVGVTGLAPWVINSMGHPAHRFRHFVSSNDAGCSWRYEVTAGAADWVYGQGFPTLNGLTRDGIAQSVRVYWNPTPSGPENVYGFTAPALRQQSRASTGTKTITVEALLPTAITYNRFNVRFDLSYIDNTGVVRTETQYGGDLQASSQTWTNAASFPNHSAKKLVFTTAYQVAQYTEVNFEVTLLGNCPTGTQQYLYFDPAFAIA